VKSVPELWGGSSERTGAEDVLNILLLFIIQQLAVSSLLFAYNALVFLPRVFPQYVRTGRVVVL